MNLLDINGPPLLSPRIFMSALDAFGVIYLAGALVCLALDRGRRSLGESARWGAGLAVAPVLVLASGQVDGLLFAFPWKLTAIAGLAWWGLRSHASIRRWLAAPPSPPGEFYAREPSAERILRLTGWTVLILAWGVMLAPALAPPINYDVLEYHLAIVPHVFRTGLIQPIPHVFYTSQPIATEMLYTLAAVIEQTPWGLSSGVLQWLLNGLAIALLARVLLLLGTPAVIVPWLGLLFVTHPVLFKFQLDRLTDLTGTVMVLSGLAVSLRPSARGGAPARAVIDAPRALMLGLIAGGAISSKWTNAGTAALVLACVTAILSWSNGPERMNEAASELSGETLRERLTRGGINAAMWAVGLLVVLLPWMLWLWIRAGNPFSPFAAGLFPTAAWGAERLEFLMETHGRLSPLSGAYWHNLYSRLSSPRLGPPLMALIVCIVTMNLVLEWRRRAREAGDILRDSARPVFTFILAIIAGATGACLLWGQLRFAQDRFLAPVIAAEFAVLGAGLAWLDKRSHRLIRPLAAGALALWTLPALMGNLNIFRALPYWPHALGRITGEEFIRHGMGGHTSDLFMAANTLPEGSKILAIGEARGYYLRRKSRLATVFDDHPLRAAFTGDASWDEARRRLIGEGYDYIVANPYETARLLDFHPPPVLLADKNFLALRAGGQAAYPALARDYAGYSEFGPEPLAEDERRAYRLFLQAMRGQAYFRPGSAPESPLAFWIAPLRMRGE